MMDPTPMQLATTDELLDELLNRFNHFIFAAVDPSKEHTDLYRLAFKGRAPWLHLQLGNEITERLKKPGGLKAT